MNIEKAPDPQDFIVKACVHFIVEVALPFIAKGGFVPLAEDKLPRANQPPSALQQFLLVRP